MQKACADIAANSEFGITDDYSPTFTLIVVQKQNHTRFWAKNVDNSLFPATKFVGFNSLKKFFLNLKVEKKCFEKYMANRPPPFLSRNF